MTPGYKTSEFWITAIVVTLGALMASGLLADGSTPMRIAGLAASVLKALGYTASRAMVKVADSKAVAANDNVPAPIATDTKAAA